MRRSIAATLAALMLAAAPAAGLTEDAPQAAALTIHADEAAIAFPAVPGFCAAGPRYAPLVERLRGLARYDVVLLDCANQQAGGDAFPMLAVSYAPAMNEVGHTRRELFQALDAFPQSMWDASMGAGAKSGVDKVTGAHLAPQDATVDLGVTKQGYDDNGFYLSGLMLAQGGGREGVAAVGMAFTLVRGKALIVMVLRRGQAPEDVEWSLAKVKEVARGIMLANGV